MVCFQHRNEIIHNVSNLFNGSIFISDSAKDYCWQRPECYGRNIYDDVVVVWGRTWNDKYQWNLADTIKRNSMGMENMVWNLVTVMSDQFWKLPLNAAFLSEFEDLNFSPLRRHNI